MKAGSDRWNEAQRFIYALAGHYNVSAHLPMDHLPDESPEAHAILTKMLSEQWSVNGAEDLRRRLAELGEGGHRRSQQQLVRHYSLACRPELAARREEMLDKARTDPQALDNIWRMDVVQANRYNMRGVPLIAFDAGRAIMLARAAMFLDWIEPDALWPYLYAVGADVQRSCASWVEYAADYRAGFALWQGSATKSFHDSILDDLLKPDGYWTTIAWGSPDLALPLSERHGSRETLFWTLDR